MTIFFTLILKLLPLYIIIFLGYLAGKKLKVQKESIAPLLIYVISPVVVFSGVVSINLTGPIISLPLLYFIPACLTCLLFYFIGGRFYSTGSERNILAFASGTGNTGYFGIPLILALYDPTYFGIAVFILLGGIIYENSIGFYITARGQFSARQAFIKVLKLPTIYAFIVGIIVSVNSWSISPTISEAVTNFKGAYVVLGMMLIGLGLSQVTKSSIDHRFTLLSFIAKFLILPIIMTSIVLVDSHFFHFYNSLIYTVLLIMSIVPIASNTVALATLFNVHPEKMALTVLLSTLFALVYIPLFVSFLFPLIL